MTEMNSISVSLLAIGDEILRGEIRDTNSAWLAELLLENGIPVRSITSCGDNHAEIVRELRHSVSLSPVVITTGGLGPTSDDITRDGVAEIAGAELQLHAPSLEKLKANAQKRGRPLHKVSERQAYFPQGSRILENPVGTADSFILPINRPAASPSYVVSLPGVPLEMKRLVTDYVLPFLLEHFRPVPRIVRRFKCFGVSEAYLGQCIEDCRPPESVSISYRPVFPEVWIRFSANREDLSDGEFNSLCERCIQKIGHEFVFSADGTETMSEVVGKLLRQKSLRVTAAESCSGGLVSDALVSTAGSSAYFLSSFVTYSNQAKTELLNVDPELLQRHGAVSAEVAQAMALGARAKSGADISVSVTGIAGPDGGSEEKPVGTVWLGVSYNGTEKAIKHFFPIERNRFRKMTAQLALDLIRRSLLGYNITWEAR